MMALLEPLKVWAVRWDSGTCVLLDQRKIPSIETYNRYEKYSDVVRAISSLEVRGAPAIGVAGAYAVVLAAIEARALEASQRESFLKNALSQIRDARPTAVNLEWAVARMEPLIKNQWADYSIEALEREAIELHQEDIGFSQKMASLGAPLIPENSNVITYCNTGDLATGGGGTAFGVLAEAYRQGRINHVFPCETRPVLQGARLTAWELQKNEIPFTLICDNMAAKVISSKNIGAVILGSDRIVANGDVCNKVGSFGLAVMCKHFGIPFIAVAPSSTFDLSLDHGDKIPIEERNSEEIVSVLGDNRFPNAIDVFNPAFDVTPAELVSAIVCEKGVIEKPNADKIRKMFN